MSHLYSNRKTRKAAIKEMPSISFIIKVVGGWFGYEYYPDYLLAVDYKPNKKHFVK